MLRPSAARKPCRAIRSRMRSATASAPGAPVSGRISANSSPPKRATMSVSRALPRMIAPASTSARLPARCPWLSLIDLKPSRSMNSRESGRPFRLASARFAPQSHVEVTRVVQAGQIVGDRQRFRPLQQQRSIERETGRAQQHVERTRAPWVRATEAASTRRGRRRPARRLPARDRAAETPTAASAWSGGDAVGRRRRSPDRNRSS